MRQKEAVTTDTVPEITSDHLDKKPVRKGDEPDIVEDAQDAAEALAKLAEELEALLGEPEEAEVEKSAKDRMASRLRKSRANVWATFKEADDHAEAQSAWDEAHTVSKGAGDKVSQAASNALNVINSDVSAYEGPKSDRVEIIAAGLHRLIDGGYDIIAAQKPKNQYELNQILDGLGFKAWDVLGEALRGAGKSDLAETLASVMGDVQQAVFEAAKESRSATAASRATEAVSPASVADAMAKATTANKALSDLQGVLGDLSDMESRKRFPKLATIASVAFDAVETCRWALDKLYSGLSANRAAGSEPIKEHTMNPKDQLAQELRIREAEQQRDEAQAWARSVEHRIRTLEARISEGFGQHYAGGEGMGQLAKAGLKRKAYGPGDTLSLGGQSVQIPAPLHIYWLTANNAWGVFFGDGKSPGGSGPLKIASDDSEMFSFVHDWKRDSEAAQAKAEAGEAPVEKAHNAHPMGGGEPYADLAKAADHSEGGWGKTGGGGYGHMRVAKGGKECPECGDECKSSDESCPTCGYDFGKVEKADMLHDFKKMHEADKLLADISAEDVKRETPDDAHFSAHDTFTEMAMEAVGHLIGDDFDTDMLDDAINARWRELEPQLSNVKKLFDVSEDLDKVASGDSGQVSSNPGPAMTVSW